MKSLCKHLRSVDWGKEYGTGRRYYCSHKEIIWGDFIKIPIDIVYCDNMCKYYERNLDQILGMLPKE